MRKKIKNYDNYYIYDNGDVLNINSNVALLEKMVISITDYQKIIKRK